MYRKHLCAFLGASPLEELFQSGKALVDFFRVASADLGIANIEKLYHGIRRCVAIVEVAIL